LIDGKDVNRIIPKNLEKMEMEKNIIKDEVKELLEVQDYLIKKFNIKPIKTTFKDVQGGRAYYDTRKITMPTWIFYTSLEYCYSYMIHEVLHFILWDKYRHNGHGIFFKEYETDILKEFGLTAKHSKAYIKELKCSASGKKYAVDMVEVTNKRFHDINNLFI
jgi:predicted SprT family Zn-dependent metalloprotease